MLASFHHPFLFPVLLFVFYSLFQHNRKSLWFVLSVSLGFTGAEEENFSRGMVGRTLGWFWLVILLCFFEKVYVENGEKNNQKPNYKSEM